MGNYFARHPFATFVAIVLGLAVASYFFPSGNLIYAGIFLGAAAFANSLWLNERINRIQDTLAERGLAHDVDFIVDDNTRLLLGKFQNGKADFKGAIEKAHKERGEEK